MVKVLLVGAGGLVGSVLRYLVSGAAQGAAGSATFPVGTLAVNLSGCFVVGVLAQLAEGRGLFTAESRLFVLTGILGGYTTFSAFGNETVALLRGREGLLAALNVSVHVFAGLGCVLMGRYLAQLVWR